MRRALAALIIASASAVALTGCITLPAPSGAATPTPQPTASALSGEAAYLDGLEQALEANDSRYLELRDDSPAEFEELMLLAGQGWCDFLLANPALRGDSDTRRGAESGMAPEDFDALGALAEEHLCPA